MSQLVAPVESSSLAAYGWDAAWEAQLAAAAGGDGVPARVLVEYRRIYDVVTAAGVVRAVVAGRLRQGGGGDAPAVGDWAIARPAPNGGSAAIDGILPRRSAFVRRNPGADRTPQVLAANVDTVFLVDALDRPPNLRRIERYLVMAWESGATPVIALSKADLCGDVAAAVRTVESIAGGVPVVAYSAVTDAGLEGLTAYLRAGQTVALLGPSGVGKSTAVNHFCGATVQAVAAVRDFDGKGRHTTTRRELLRTPSGALVVDTPGMRELQLWDAANGLDRAFADVDLLAVACYFADCRHTTEPECAVLAAVEAGALTGERLESYRKLLGELRHAQTLVGARSAVRAPRHTRTITRAYNAEHRRRAQGR